MFVCDPQKASCTSIRTADEGCPGPDTHLVHPKNTRILLVLDIDETLLHASTTRLAGPCDYQAERTWIYKRPGVDAFLQYCQANFLLGIWTSARASYAQEICDNVFPWLHFEFVFSEHHCLWPNGKSDHENSLKPLSKLQEQGFDLPDIIALDDSSAKHRLNPENLLSVTPFFAGMQQRREDTALRDIQSHLELIRKRGGLRSMQEQSQRLGEVQC